MSLSKAERLENIRDTLRIALIYLGDNAISGKWLDASDPVFSNVQATTWKHLTDTWHAIEHHTSTSLSYELTGLGWRRALEVSGELQRPEFKERLGELCAAFKDTLKGRQGQTSPMLQAFAKQTGIPWQFIFNVIESGVIKYCFKQRGVAWYKRGVGIRIPIDVGLDLL
jgi:hypothetical protein